MAKLNEPEEEMPVVDPDLQRKVDAIQGSLLDDLPDDRRLDSGVAQDRASSEEDFVQMTGLTRPRPVAGPLARPGASPKEDMNPERPVSFFEKGVLDVDVAMAPEALDEAETPESRQEVLRETFATSEGKSPVAGLEGIIADLSRERRPEPPEPAAEEMDAVLDEELLPPAVSGPAGRPVEPPDLAEAESLLQALQDQPREDVYEKRHELAKAAAPDEDEGETATDVDEGEERDESVYRQPASPHRRRSRRRGGKLRRRLMRWGVRFVAILVVACAAYAAYWWAKPRLASPEWALDAARKLTAEGEYRKASEAYQAFVRLHSDSPEAPEAQFDAALSLMMSQSSSFDDAQDTQRRALALFEDFLKQNPGNYRAARAQSLTGLLYYRLGECEKAVEVLRDADLRRQDAMAALPALRTLARAYVQLGEYSLAESTYKQAAAMPNNYNADVDYHELGSLLQKRAESAQTEEERLSLERAAVDSWDHAMRVPGIDPVNRARIKEKRDWMFAELQEKGAATPVPETVEKGSSGETTQPPAQGVPQLEPETAAPPPTGNENAQDAEPDPAKEAEHLAATAPAEQ